MDHRQAQELDLADRYVMGQLTTDESAQFEEHFVDCLPCLDRLEATRGLVQGLHTVAIDQSDQQSAPPPHLYSPRSLSQGWVAVAFAGLFLIALTVVLIELNQIRRTRIEIDQARSTADQWKERYDAERESAALADKRREEAERELREKRNQQQTGESNARDSLLAAAARPQVNFLIFEPTSARGGESGSNELKLPRSPIQFAILVALQGETGYKDYRMTIQLGSQVIWKASGFKPNKSDSLTAGLNSDLFRSGEYLLTVEGLSATGKVTIVGKYRLRVSKV